MKKLFVILALMILTAGQPALAQSLQARVNRAEIPEGETFLLSLDYDGGQSDETPDFSALDKDFTVYSISNAYRTNIVNGQMSQSRQWNLVLMPKNSGKVIIPGLKVGNVTSQPVEITVRKAGEESGTNPAGKTSEPRFKMSGKADNLQPYVQQQVNYVLTIYDTGGLQGDEPIFLSQNDDWIIKSLGAPQITNQVIDGKNLREIKFTYALFPQKSGELEIPAVKFNGYYLTRSQRSDPFGGIFNDEVFLAGFGMSDVFATRNPVVLNAKPIKVSVKPAAPENRGGWWLPATEVTMAAQFEPSQPVFRAGEAVSRTIFLKAAGVIDSQLPEISFKQVPGLRQYPEKPETKMTVENGQIVSLAKLTNVYIPEETGPMVLPALEVNWFNVRKGKTERAVLPSMQINVLPGSMPAMSLGTEQENRELKAPAVPVETEVVEQVSSSKLYLMLGAAFILGILLSYIIMKSLSGNRTDKVRNYKKYVIARAKEKDLRGLRDGLLEWGRQHFRRDNLSNLKDLAELVDDTQFNCEAEKLTEALYARSSQNWKAGSFIKVFERISNKKVRKNNDEEPLPKLYK